MSEVSHQASASYGLSDYAALFRRRWGWLIVGLLCGLGLGYIAVDRLPPTYLSSASVIVEPTGLTRTTVTGGRTSGEINLDTEAQLVRSHEVASRVQEALNSTLSPAELSEQVTITVPPNSQILRIGFEAETPQQAQSGAAAFATAYLDSRGDLAKADIDGAIEQLTDEISALSSSLEDIIDRLSDLDEFSAERPLVETQRTLLLDQIATLNREITTLSRLDYRPGRIITAADLPEEPSGLGSREIYAATLSMGFLLGLGLLLLRERTDRRLLGAPDATGDTGIRLIGKVPPSTPWGSTPQAERAAYERLRNVLVAMAGRHKTVLLSGVDARVPVTAVSETLANHLAATGRRVVLVDAGAVHQKRHNGLSDVLPGGDWNLVGLPDGGEAWKDTGAVHVDAGTRPDLLHHLLAGATAQAAFASLRNLVDIVLIVAPADDALAQTLGTLSDGVVHVAMRRRSHRSDLVVSIQGMNQVDARSIGVVLIDYPPFAVATYKAARHKWREALATRREAKATTSVSPQRGKLEGPVRPPQSTVETDDPHEPLRRLMQERQTPPEHKVADQDASEDEPVPHQF